MARSLVATRGTSLGYTPKDPGGYVGFLARMADGRVVRECDALWDAVPDEGIASLSLMQEWTHEIARAEAAPGRRFYFYNEVVSMNGGMGILGAKGIGYVDGDRAVELRYDLLPGPAVAALRIALQCAMRVVEKAHAITSRCFPKDHGNGIRRQFVVAHERAAAAMEATQVDPRVTWRTFPASDLRLSEKALRSAA